MVNVWKDRSAPLLNTMQAFYGIGSFLAPQIAYPFLIVHYNDTSPNASQVSSLNTPLDAMSTSTTSLSDTFPNVTLLTAIMNSTSRTSIRTAGSVELRHSTTPSSITTTESMNTSALGNLRVKQDHVIRAPSIVYPYITISGITFLAVLMFVCCYIYELAEHSGSYNLNDVKRKESLAFKEVLDPNSCAVGHRTYSVMLLSLLFLFNFAILGGEQVLWKFTYSYAVEAESLRFTASQATWLNTAFGIGVTGGRLFAAGLALCIHPRILLPVELAGNLVVGVVLLVWGLSHQILVWTCFVLLGLLIGPLFPTAQSWADRYLIVTPVAMSILYLGASCGVIAFSYLGGHLFQLYGAISLPWICVSYSAAAILIYISLQIMGSYHGDRYDKMLQTESALKAVLVYMSKVADTLSRNGQPPKGVNSFRKRQSQEIVY